MDTQALRIRLETAWKSLDVQLYQMQTKIEDARTAAQQESRAKLSRIDFRHGTGIIQDLILEIRTLEDVLETLGD